MSTRPAPSLPLADRLLPRARARERVLWDETDELADAAELADPEPTGPERPEGPEGPEEAAGAASPQVSQ
jgi:hypothetical protein